VKPRAHPLAWFLAAGPLLLLLALPGIALIVKGSSGAFLQALSTEETWEALGVSLRTSLVALGAIVAFGTPLGYLLGKGRFWGKEALRAVVATPAVLPPAAAGLGMLLAFGRNGLLGPVLESAGIVLPFTATAVVLAQVFVASPFHVLQAASAFEAVDAAVEDSAMLDGAGSWGVFWHIVLPQVRPALLSGATLAWARALGEFGATILFAGSLAGVTRTMPLAVYLEFEGNMDVAIALSCLLVAFAVVGVLVGRLFARNNVS